MRIQKICSERLISTNTKRNQAHDSLLQLLDEGDIYNMVINGWTFSFEADLSTSAPMNIMNGRYFPNSKTHIPLSEVLKIQMRF
jgi:hypothetical protein